MFLTSVPGDQIVEADLRICRVGDEFRFFKRFAGETVWQEVRLGPDSFVMGNGAARPTPGVLENGTIRFVRPELPDRVQVGLITNPGFPPNNGIGQSARFEIRPIGSFDLCVSP